MKKQQFTLIAHTFGLAMETEYVLYEPICEGTNLNAAKNFALDSIHADVVLNSVNAGRFYTLRHDDRRNAESVFFADGYILDASEDEDEAAESLGWDMQLGYLTLTHGGYSVIFAPECDENAERIELADIVEYCNAQLGEAMDADNDDFYMEEEELLKLFK